MVNPSGAYFAHACTASHVQSLATKDLPLTGMLLSIPRRHASRERWRRTDHSEARIAFVLSLATDTRLTTSLLRDSDTARRKRKGRTLRGVPWAFVYRRSLLAEPKRSLYETETKTRSVHLQYCVWSVRNRGLGVARLDFLSGLRNRDIARPQFLI